jgi:hypothetical protein
MSSQAKPPQYAHAQWSHTKPSQYLRHAQKVRLLLVELALLLG